MRERGYFGIGVYRPKFEVNLGTLWRHAHLYGAAFMFTVDADRTRQQPSDTTKNFRHAPLFNWNKADLWLPFNCSLVAVELSDTAVSLPEFRHPDRAVYLLGAEDDGLPQDILRAADFIIQIPALEAQSMNVATAGTIVMYDRHTKRSCLVEARDG